MVACLLISHAGVTRGDQLPCITVLCCRSGRLPEPSLISTIIPCCKQGALSREGSQSAFTLPATIWPGLNRLH